jgi:putative DNA primase/helicase
MIYARRGVGKTFAAQAIAWAVVTGTAWLRFEVRKPTGVLYIDGEMPREDLQSRFRSIAEGSQQQIVRPLRLLSEDLDDQPLPSLATAEGQRVVEAELEAFPEVGLVVIDAVTTLCLDARAGESDSKSWDSMQSWLLSLRRRGVASLVLHHSGKTGDQRGTSKREDVMTQVIRLDQPQDYRAEEGARFELRFVKARGVLGTAARPMEVQLESDARGRLEWSYRDLEGSKKQRAWGMFGEGLKAMDVAEELDVSRATAFRWQKSWRTDSGAASLA